MSSRSAVAIHALTLLSRRGQDQLLTSTEIAESLDSNPVAVRRILGQLRTAGLVEATEGYGGGWRLTRPSRQISLYDAYAAVEDGPLLTGHAHPPSAACVVGRNITALLDAEFAEAEAALQRRLARTSIATVRDRILDLERKTVRS